MAAPVPERFKQWSPPTQLIDFTSPTPASQLKGKSVLVTGGASGLGLGCVLQLALYGSIVTIADLQTEAGNKVASELTAQGHKVQFVQCDVSNYKSQVSAFKAAIHFGNGSIDIVIPMAGILPNNHIVEEATQHPVSLDTDPPEPGYRAVDVNLKGAYHTTYLALHYFQLPSKTADAFQKTIILVASVAAYSGYLPSPTYTLSKFGVRGLFYSIRGACQALPSPIRVNLLAPWYVPTPMTAGIPAASASGFASVETVVEAVMRMAGDERVSGRAVIVMPKGLIDLEDDIYGGYAGTKFQNLMVEWGKGMEEAARGSGS